jgi:hypothetical protein
MLCCWFQVEEAYRSAEDLGKRMGIDANMILRFEVPLLQGLGFDLVVHSPYRALEGLFLVCGWLAKIATVVGLVSRNMECHGSASSVMLVDVAEHQVIAAQATRYGALWT